VNGFVPDSEGNPITDQPIPFALEDAVAFLAHFYRQFSVQDSLANLEGLETATSPFIADLPIRVQNAIWPYLSAEAKGVAFINTDIQSRIAHSVEQRSDTERQVKTGRRPVAAATFG